MERGLTVKIVDVDPNYLGVEVRASNERFAGSAYIYADVDQLREFAGRIAGFPSSISDQRNYEFGKREPKFAGGFCGLRFYCVDSSGHARLDIEIHHRDPLAHQETAQVHFSLYIEAADIDRFTKRLLETQERKSGEACLPEAL